MQCSMDEVLELQGRDSRDSQESQELHIELEHSRTVQFTSDTNLTRVAMSAARSVSKQSKHSQKSHRFQRTRVPLSTRALSLSPGMIDSKYVGSPKRTARHVRSPLKLGKSAPA